MTIGALSSPSTGDADLGDVLATTVRGLVAAQEELDRFADRQAARVADTPAGTVVAPPRAFHFRDVEIDLELSATLASGSKPRRASLRVRGLDPVMIGLYGRASARSLRVRTRIESRSAAVTPAGRASTGGDGAAPASEGGER